MSRRLSKRVGRGNNTTTVTVAHVEYITDIRGTNPFTMQIDQAVNPGLPFLFPWLHQMAAMFETYRIIKLIFFFKSTSADAILSDPLNPSTSLGSVIMMAQYNVLLPPPSNKREMLNNATAKSCKPSNSMAFVVNPHASYKTLFVRTPITPDDGDRRLYDQCDFHLATEGMQGTSGNIGELSVMAVLKFSKPTLGNIGIPFDMFSWNFPYTQAANGNRTQLLSFVNGGVFQNELIPLPGSTAGGVIQQDSADNVFRYKFGDLADAVVGSIFEVCLNAQLGFTTPLNPSANYVWHAPNHGDTAYWLFTNCALTNFHGDRGLTCSLPTDPTVGAANQLNTLAYSNLRPPATPYTATADPEYNGNFIQRFYVQITGPNATIGTTTTANSDLKWRWFANDAPGSPAAMISGGHTLYRTLSVKQVALP